MTRPSGRRPDQLRELTIDPDATHDSWTKTFSNPEIYRWLLEHQRSARSKGK